MSNMERDDELDRMLARSFGPPHSRAARGEYGRFLAAADAPGTNKPR